jgi:hypothetical protein
VVDEWGPIARAAFVHDVLCDAANEWARAMDDYEHRVRHLPGSEWGPKPVPPRFLGADIDGALRAAARDLGAANGERWLYWVAVRWSALFGSRGRRHRWTSTLGPVLALTVPALLVALPAVVGALVSRLLLVVCELAAWPWTRTPPTLAPRARRPLVHGLEAPRQMPEGRAQLWHAAQSHGLTPGNAARVAVLTGPRAFSPAWSPCTCPPEVVTAGIAHIPSCPYTPPTLADLARAGAPEDLLADKSRESAARTDTGGVRPATGPQAVVHARRVAARHRDEAPAPWCASFLQQCTPGCDPARQCDRLCLAGCAPDGSIHMPTCPNLPEEATR